MKITIANIVIGNRFRADMGDLEGLAESIKSQGLLQPVGVTEANELVFGERRLRACRDILGWDEIDARVVSVTSIIEGEHAENEIRKAFTTSERVAIGQAIESRLTGRHGSNQHIKRGSEEVQNFAPAASGAKTRKIAAEAAGFGNHTTYEAAKRVIQKAVPGVVEALDKGQISVAAAALVAEQPPEEQNRIVSVSKAEQKAAVQMLRNVRRVERDGLPIYQLVQTIFEGFRLIAETKLEVDEFLQNALPASLEDMKVFAPRVRSYLEAVERTKINVASKNGKAAYEAA